MKKAETAAVLLLLTVLATSVLPLVSALTAYTWKEGDYFVYEMVISKNTYQYRWEVLEETSEYTKVKMTYSERGTVLFENTYRIKKDDKAGDYDPTVYAKEADQGTLKTVSFTVNGETKDVRVREWVKDGMTVWVSEDAGILLKVESEDFKMTLIETNINVPAAGAAGGIPGFPFESILIGLGLGVILILATRKTRPIATLGQ